MGKDGLPRWAGKVAKEKIQRLYEQDARGVCDEELITTVGWELWSRCDSILTVTEAHYGRVHCPSCAALIESPRPWEDEDVLLCSGCGWGLPWRSYHQTYQGKQLFGANAVDVFAAYHQAFPKTADAQGKMVLIDQLIHGFHSGLKELGRPVGANLIQGNLKEVIQFLDGLTTGDTSAAGLGNSRAAWREKLDGLSWSHLFMRPE